MSVLRRRRWPWLLVSGFLVIGGLLKWSDWNRQSSEEQFHLQSSPAEMTVRQEPVVQASPSSTLAVPEAGIPLDPVTIDPQRFDDWYQHLPKKESSLPSGSLRSAGMAGKSADHDFSPAETYSKTFSEPIRIKRDREKIWISQPGETTVIDQPLSVSSGQPEGELPYLQDLPPQVQAQIPKMQFAGHAYAHAPSKRMIIINGKIMREGDRLDTGTRLAEITWKGAIIDNNGVLFQVKCY
jgi:hypothetical protein